MRLYNKTKNNRSSNPAFYTLMEKLENVHLVKDVGMFPYILYKEFGYNAHIVSYGISGEMFPYLRKEVNGLRLDIRKKYTGNTIFDGIIWIAINARKIDMLNLYHYKPSTFIWTAIYKIFNRRGVVWVKLDIDAEAGKKMYMKPFSAKWNLTKFILGKRVLVSAETRSFCQYANEKWPIKLKWIPNGIELNQIERPRDKDKIILTVGRLGTKQKATEILIKAFMKALPDISEEWKLVLVGSTTLRFIDSINKLFQNNPCLRKRIILYGEINGRDEINAIYRSASIFTMPSRWEGFGIAAIEAMAKGCYLLTSDLDSYTELRYHDRYGEGFPVDDVDAYAKKIVDICNKYDKDNLKKDDLRDYMINHYSYEHICAHLNKLYHAYIKQ